MYVINPIIAIKSVENGLSPYTLTPCRSFLNYRNDTEVQLKYKCVPIFPFIVVSYLRIITKQNEKHKSEKKKT